MCQKIKFFSCFGSARLVREIYYAKILTLIKYSQWSVNCENKEFYLWAVAKKIKTLNLR